MKKKILLLISVIVFILLVVLLWGIFKNLTTDVGREEFKNVIINMGPWGYLAIIGLTVAQIFLFILPGEPIEILAGMCYGGLWGTLFIMASSAIISALIFLLVRISVTLALPSETLFSCIITTSSLSNT